jgi:hypothetical protein
MARYYSDGQERWLAEIYDNSGVELDDGSVWEISPRDHLKITNWVRFSSIAVAELQTGKGLFYVLTNRSFNAQVYARFLGLRSEGAKPTRGAA